MRLLKELRRRFRGGPDFNLCQEVTAVLENTQLTLSLPVSNVEALQVPLSINFPYRQPGWFENNAEYAQQHHHVHIISKNWCYLAKGLTAFFSELGMLSISIVIKRVSPEKKINAMELDSLGRYVVAEYDEYYNSPVIGENSRLGANTKIIKRTEEDCRGNHPSFNEERIAEQVALCLKSRGHPPIPPHQIKAINNRKWVFYSEPGPGIFFLNRSRMYCLPISEQYYVSFNFYYRVDLKDKFKHWESAAEAAEKRIMESIRIESVGTKLLE